MPNLFRAYPAGQAVQKAGFRPRVELAEFRWNSGWEARSVTALKQRFGREFLGQTVTAFSYFVNSTRSLKKLKYIVPASWRNP